MTEMDMYSREYYTFAEELRLLLLFSGKSTEIFLPCQFEHGPKSPITNG